MTKVVKKSGLNQKQRFRLAGVCAKLAADLNGRTVTRTVFLEKALAEYKDQYGLEDQLPELNFTRLSRAAQLADIDITKCTAYDSENRHGPVTTLWNRVKELEARVSQLEELVSRGK